MTLSVPSTLQALARAGAAAQALTAWSRKLRGNQRALVMELRDNLQYLDLVAEHGVPLDEVLGKLSTAEYERLAKDAFDFNALQRRRIPDWPSLDGTDLQHWPGKRTGQLVEVIYEKLRELIIRYPHLGHDKRYRWGVRVTNIRKRIWLLLRHVG